MLLSYGIDLLESSFWLLSTYNPTVQNLDVCCWFLFCVFELKLIISSLTANIPQGSESECSLEQKSTDGRITHGVSRTVWRTNRPFNKKELEAVTVRETRFSGIVSLNSQIYPTLLTLS